MRKTLFHCFLIMINKTQFQFILYKISFQGAKIIVFKSCWRINYKTSLK